MSVNVVKCGGQKTTEKLGLLQYQELNSPPQICVCQWLHLTRPLHRSLTYSCLGAVRGQPVETVLSFYHMGPRDQTQSSLAAEPSCWHSAYFLRQNLEFTDQGRLAGQQARRLPFPGLPSPGIPGVWCCMWFCCGCWDGFGIQILMLIQQVLLRLSSPQSRSLLRELPYFWNVGAKICFGCSNNFRRF